MELRVDMDRIHEVAAAVARGAHGVLSEGLEEEHKDEAHSRLQEGSDEHEALSSHASQLSEPVRRAVAGAFASDPQGLLGQLGVHISDELAQKIQQRIDSQGAVAGIVHVDV